MIYTLLLRKGRNLGSGNCGSYRFGNDTSSGGNGSHNFTSCEWAVTAYDEGMGTFLGVRSVTGTQDTNVWQCTCANNAIQHVCSNTVSIALGDLDRIVPCMGGTFAGVGDNFATTNSHCTRVSAGANTGCATCFSSPASCQNCPDGNGDGACDNFQATWGFRNEHNVTRFLWDMIDSSTDSGQDDTDESMASLATLFFGIPCVSGSGYDEDGNCNESNRASPASCEPTSVIGNAIIPMMGTRDSVNVWDLGEIVPGSQTSERTINCVDTATD